MDVDELYGVVGIAPTASVGEHCTFGFPKEARLRAFQATGVVEPGAPVEIGDRCLVFNQVVVYEGVVIGADTVVEDRVRIGYDCRIGAGSRLMYGAYICDRVRVGPSARIAGFICDGSSIGARSTVMGDLVHEYTRPHQAWWGTVEADPVIEEDCVVGYGAVVVGGVRIGPQSYVPTAMTGRAGRRCAATARLPICMPIVPTRPIGVWIGMRPACRPCAGTGGLIRRSHWSWRWWPQPCPTGTCSRSP